MPRCALERSVQDGSNAGTEDVRRVLLVGPGFRFLSGLSQYTHRLAVALNGATRVSAILIRQIIPTRLYPGRQRVGQPLAAATYPPEIPVYDGVDWYWGTTLTGALAFVRRQGPDVVVFQWWTAAVLHTYLVLALVARAMGARVVIEFHEVQDPSEATVRVARLWVRLLAGLLMRLSHGFVIHSEFDRGPLQERYGIANRPVAVIPHGPYDQYEASDGIGRLRRAPNDVCNLLCFGLIRPYKGVEDAIRAFGELPDHEARDFWLTVVGETWDRWTLPGELVAANRHRDRITFINRYVSDVEAAGFLAGADVVVLPYHRCSASGTLHTAMAVGLPVITTRVGGLAEAAEGYEGAVFVAPGDHIALAAAFHRAAAMTGRRYADRHSWERTLERFCALFDHLETRS
jgi:glycosyltransferase involved in cell wall biosynthesis